MTEVPGARPRPSCGQIAALTAELDERHHNLTDHERQARRLRRWSRRGATGTSASRTRSRRSQRAAEQAERERQEIDRRRREERSARPPKAQRKNRDGAPVKARPGPRPSRAPVIVPVDPAKDRGDACRRRPHPGKMHLNKAVAETRRRERKKKQRAGATSAAMPWRRNRRRAGPGRAEAPHRQTVGHPGLVLGEGERQRSLAPSAAMDRKEKRAMQQMQQVQTNLVREVILPETITVGSWPTAWPSAVPMSSRR